MVYEKIKEDIASFLNFYKLTKCKDVHQVVNLPKIANNNLPEIEWRYKTTKGCKYA
jgi:hypothetical protein